MVPRTSSTLPRLLLVHHVAQRLGVPRRTVRYWAATGRIPAIKAGPKIWKFAPAEVERLALSFAILRRRRPIRAHAGWR
jgi:excisionase family DNA binding protein